MFNVPNNVDLDNNQTEIEDVDKSTAANETEISQNNQLVCWKCGEPLEQDQLFCPKCGSKSDAPLEKNNSIAEFNENAKKRKKEKRRSLS